MSEIIDTVSRKFTRTDDSLILIFGDASIPGPHQQFNFHGSDEVADRIVLAWNSYASSQAEIERLTEALQVCATLLPRYRHAGKTTGDDEELAAVLETITEALSGVQS